LTPKRLTPKRLTWALGFLLTIVVVFMFLGSGRSTIITGLALPNSLIGAFLLILLEGFFVWRHMAAASADISGVWHGQTSGLSYVIDKHDDSYRLSVGGHRLLIKDIQKDRMTGQLVLTVRTDSGLLALWSFKAGKDAAGTPMLQLDQDSVASDELHLQRELTPVDRSRLVQSKIAKKPLWSPAFDCGKAGTDVERMICSDQSLGAMDVQMAKAVHAAVNDAAISDAQKTDSIEKNFRVMRARIRRAFSPEFPDTFHLKTGFFFIGRLPPASWDSPSGCARRQASFSRALST